MVSSQSYIYFNSLFLYFTFYFYTEIVQMKINYEGKIIIPVFFFQRKKKIKNYREIVNYFCMKNNELLNYKKNI